ncbi:MAG: hypothetical protein B7C55_12840 [Actinomycetales bacterium mxb001]|nr:MAG: hypothetical protein B7C55_12840 [Actinomycetales bacterium mxb001]
MSSHSATTTSPLYRWSVLATGFARMWRAWAIVIPVVIVNAAVQGLLLLPNVLPYLTVPFIVVALVSLIVLVLSFTLVATAVLGATTGRVGWGDVTTGLGRRFLLVLVWATGLVVVVLIGVSLYVVPGLIVIALTPYLLLAVIDGKRNPIAVNFRTIGARWGRWLITVIIMGVLCFAIWFLSVATGFFITGAPGAIVGWLAIGIIATWFVCAWALIYRSVNPR